MLNSKKSALGLENKLRDASKNRSSPSPDRRISNFGLLELSRQRLRPSWLKAAKRYVQDAAELDRLEPVNQPPLKYFKANGRRSNEKWNNKSYGLYATGCCTTFLSNEKKSDIIGIETRQNVKVILVPNPNIPKHPTMKSESDQDSQMKKSDSFQFLPRNRCC